MVKGGNVSVSRNIIKALMQLAIMSVKTRAYYLPVRFQSIRCDPVAWKQACEEAPGQIVDAQSNCGPFVNVVVAKGLEIRGLKCSLAPRNLNAQVPSLESYHFIANSRIDALDKFSNQLLGQYQSTQSGKALEELASKIDDRTYAKYYELPTEEMKLLAALKQIIEGESTTGSSIEQSLKNLLVSEKALDRDLLANVYTREYFLKPYLDLVLENLGSNKLKFLEVNKTGSLVSVQINEFLQSLNTISDMDYTVAHPDVSSLSEDALAGSAASLKLTDWQISKLSMPSEVNNCDLIVYKDVNTQPLR